MKLKYVILFLLLTSFYSGLNAQNIEYGVMLDTTHMLIGDQQHLTFKVISEPGIQIRFPHLKDTIVRGVEIISGPQRDSVQEADGRWLIEERYLITSFDTGVYQIPSMPIVLEGSEYNNVLRTDPLAFVVSTFQVDLQKGNYDIVMPYATPWTFSEILPYLLWILLGIIFIGGGIWLYWRYKKNKPLFTPQKEEVPPYMIAIRSLDEIKETKLWQAGREKEYYTRLTDVVRQYMDDELGISAMEQTSGEILQELKHCSKVDAKEQSRMAELLNTSDYVKFAKYAPLQDENARYLDTAYDFVNSVYQRVQQELNERQQEASEALRKTEEIQPLGGEKPSEEEKVFNNREIEVDR